MIQIKHQNVRILSSLMIIFNQIEMNLILIETTSILYKYNLYSYKFQKNILILNNIFFLLENYYFSQTYYKGYV